jgi:wobble nucleotide-excising tRNase
MNTSVVYYSHVGTPHDVFEGIKQYLRHFKSVYDKNNKDIADLETNQQKLKEQLSIVLKEDNFKIIQELNQKYDYQNKHLNKLRLFNTNEPHTKLFLDLHNIFC